MDFQLATAIIRCLSPGSKSDGIVTISFDVRAALSQCAKDESWPKRTDEVDFFNFWAFDKMNHEDYQKLIFNNKLENLLSSISQSIKCFKQAVVLSAVTPVHFPILFFISWASITQSASSSIAINK